MNHGSAMNSIVRLQSKPIWNESCHLPCRSSYFYGMLLYSAVYLRKCLWCSAGDHLETRQWVGRSHTASSSFCCRSPPAWNPVCRYQLGRGHWSDIVCWQKRKRVNSEKRSILKCVRNIFENVIKTLGGNWPWSYWCECVHFTSISVNQKDLLCWWDFYRKQLR